MIFNVYVNTGARQLLNLEKKGLLSREYGYVWQEINNSREMKNVSEKISGDTISGLYRQNRFKGKIRDLPSLAAIKELNEIKDFHKTITITDRHGILLAQLQTTHTCVFLSDLNEILISSLLTTEDKSFFKRKSAYDFNALARAIGSSLWKSLRSFKLHRPRGSSTIHMQVARFLLMKYDKRGYAFSEQNIARKIQEIKLAQALKLTYDNQEVLTAYINHCVSAGRGMQGYYDISMKLFGVQPKDLSLAQNLYLSRLVKWNRQVPTKIINQIKTSMPSLARHFSWSEEQQVSIIQSLDTLEFLPSQNLIPEHSHLIDLANEYWKQVCEQNGITGSQLEDMDIADPESMIRRYGNLTIALTIDYRLQSLLEQLVDNRGFGPDTTIRSDILIGSEGTDIAVSTNIPADTLRKVTVLSSDSVIKNSGSILHLKSDDTLIQNIRYKKISNHIRRSCFTYRRDTVTVAGQYFAYAIMNSRTRELLAYYSRDRLGSRLQSLHRNRIPNGSSTAKPLVYALAYDLGIYSPTDMATDDVEIVDSCAWARQFYGPSEKPTGMTYLLAAEKNGYTVHNHHKSFDGYDYLFNHLANSNNIMAVETMYRLNTDMDNDNEQSEKVRSFLLRTGTDFTNNTKYITGPSLYAAISGICSEPSAIDSINRICKNRYSIALGTLELSLYEQLHLFNLLYDGNLIVKPSKHPGLFVKKIDLAGNELKFEDSISHRTIFDTITRINPVHLGLHKRLVSGNNRETQNYDICDLYEHSGPISNFAKSGTTDDIIKPYYSEKNDKSRTNYGLWNAILRLNLKKEDLLQAIESNPALKEKKYYKQLLRKEPEQQTIDVTVSCIGECNQRHTGSPDGKTLHSYVSSSLLKQFGIPCSSGFYQTYEQQIKQETSNRVKFADFRNESDLSGWSKFMLKLKTGFKSNITGENIAFERSRSGGALRLKGKSYRAMLRFGPYMGKESKRFLSLLEQLRGPLEKEEAMKVLKEIGLMEIRNKYLKGELEQACGSLIRSALELTER
ncbi:MAG TPA: transglycosylase domain-containing protein [Chitinispirillaceae bacterium]|nr:transglycosylase domain-containing protein [Chitinispirillaceae bacterium]